MPAAPCARLRGFNKNVNYAYDAKGALHGIGTNLTGNDANTTTNVISAMSYKALGAASSISYGNNRQATLSYGPEMMRLTRMKVARPDGADKLVDNLYGYTENGLVGGITNWVDAANTRYYGYNYRNQWFADVKRQRRDGWLRYL